MCATKTKPIHKQVTKEITKYERESTLSCMSNNDISLSLTLYTTTTTSTKNGLLFGWSGPKMFVKKHRSELWEIARECQFFFEIIGLFFL